jgi:NADPH:quinone reductase-like Zn-dependent oxidoreductase/NAD(P)-dependent dehydrogenase (short-subunit alcohol dehydrogenase family)/aryl carrier-like protein
MLLFSEIVRPSIWIELVFGLMDGWWRFHDVAIRRDSPLLPVDAWLRQLREVGFAEPKEIAGADDRLGNAVFLAGAPPIARATSDDRSTTIPPRRRLVFADRQGVAEELLHRWTSDGDDVWLVTPGNAYRRISPRRFTVRPTERDDFTKLVAELSAADGPPCEEVMHFWNLDAPEGAPLSTGEIEQWQGPGLLSVLNVVQSFLATHGGAAMPRLRLVTRGTQTISADDRLTGIAAAPVLGLARVIGNEAPQFRCQAIDLDPRSRISDAVDALWRELAQDSDEEEIVLRDGGRWVSRYERSGEPRKDVSAWPNSADRPRYRLETTEQGTVEGLRFREAARPALGSGEVEIEVFAAGLNFSDVLKSLGLYPGLPAGPAPFGAECSGRITAVGSGAGPWRIGDEVIAVAPFSFASHVVARSELVIRKPRGMTFEEAATLPIAFLTASYALETMGRLSRGERVLIHAATGGVGLAALQIARNIGAEAYATAGSREKRDLLRFLGVGRVMDSRKLEFADEILAATQGEGVDVVLNSLPGEAISLGLSVLRDYGRFLEIGKRDIYADAPVGLKPFRKNVSFHAIDLDRLLRDRPRTVGELFRRLEREFAAGRLTPLPFRVFPAAQIVDAFRYMQQGRHIGKVVASMFDPPRTVVAGEDRRCRFRSDRSYLITGGLSGFGLACARWMAERGAGELVLMGRRGVASPEARAALDELTSRGVNIRVAVGDVSKSVDVERVFAEIDRNGLPLAGIIHGAMVLEDSLLTNLDAEMASRVLAPKVSGAWNLHRASEGRPLDYFVMFSSLSSVIGHAGQANYAAANTFLDQLAHHRRAQGLPATTINWGYLGDVGILARNERIAERLEGQGVRPIPIGEALEALEVVLSRRPTQIGVMRMDWGRWRQTAVGRVSPRFAGLCTAAEPTSATTDGESGSIRQQILDAPENQRVEVLTRFLRDKLARVLGAAAGQIDASQSLLSLGIDSLMAVDLRNWIERELQCTVPVVELMGSAGLAALAEVLLRQLTVGPAAETASDQVPAAAVKVSDRDALPAAESVERLNDADVDRLLAELLPKGNASPR